MRKVVLCGVLALACLLGGFRIYQVNTADFITLFPKRQYCSTGEPVSLEKGHYYFTSYDWTGYTVEVTGSTVESTDDFLQEHNAPENFLEDLNLRDDLHHKNQYLLLVHTVFRFNGEDSMEKSPINLAEFQVVGPDYTLAAVPELNQLEGFNEVLQGQSLFAITSGKPVKVDIPFFINTGFETGITLDYINQSNPGLLVTYYPEEKVISLSDN